MATTALIVDHGLQPRSATVTRAAAPRRFAGMCGRARCPVQVGAAGGRERRRAAPATRHWRSTTARWPVLLAQLDSQAETVLWGLAWFGARSIARPGAGAAGNFLASFYAACRELG